MIALRFVLTKIESGVSTSILYFVRFICPVTQNKKHSSDRMDQATQKDKS